MSTYYDNKDNGFHKYTWTFLIFILCNSADLDTAYFFVFHPLGAEAQQLFFPTPPAAVLALRLLKL